MADGYTVKRRDELETMEGSGSCNWELVRKGIECPAFGLNVVTIGPGGQIPEHDEQGSGQHEVFTILDGEAVFVLDGQEHAAPAGTFGHMDPGVTRTIRNSSDGDVTALLIGAVPADGYEPPAWG